ncbi:alanine racemase [Nocardioides sp.]|uniref:alanine racemase n=1 Tax=Nocardioides sp. TaxID=35761 RepID=UPI0039E4E683
MTSRAEIVVDLAAVRHNVRRLAYLTQTPVMVVVKADGYGHGMVEVARAAREAGAPWLGVAAPAEALRLREAGDTGRLLTWLSVPRDDLAALVERDVDLTAYTLAELDQIADAARRANRRARLQLKVDTGLSRGGAMPADWPMLFEHARKGQDRGIWKVTGIWSHLASSEVPEDPANDAQEKVFREALAELAEAGLTPEVRHLGNSAGAILRPSARFDLVRVGIAAYGLPPGPGVITGLGLRPAMTLRADLAMVKDVPAGAAVSYGGHWVAPAPTSLGLVPVGYAEGIPRAAADRAEVWIAGARRPIRGTICMDQFVVDLAGDHPPVGEDVVLFGPGDSGEPTAQEWAEAAGTISYEIVTRLGGRLTRRHIDTDREA